MTITYLKYYGKSGANLICNVVGLINVRWSDVSSQYNCRAGVSLSNRSFIRKQLFIRERNNCLTQNRGPRPLAPLPNHRLETNINLLGFIQMHVLNSVRCHCVGDLAVNVQITTRVSLASVKLRRPTIGRMN